MGVMRLSISMKIYGWTLNPRVEYDDHGSTYPMSSMHHRRSQIEQAAGDPVLPKHSKLPREEVRSGLS